MAKKKKKLILIIPAFLIIGAAIGIQTKGVFKQTLIGLVVGIIIYFFLKYRNEKINSNI
jgi:biopolymer transport protein ExbB/TolQ